MYYCQKELKKLGEKININNLAKESRKPFSKCIKKYDNRLQGNIESQYISNFWTHKHL